MQHPLPSRSDCLTPTDPALLGNPLDFIQDDHLREREICVMIDWVATADASDLDLAEHILSFLRNELPQHLADEEEDLFPLLRRRCEPDDEIDRAIRRLSTDHAHASADTPHVVTILDRLTCEGTGLSALSRKTLAQYATHSRHHLILENAIILPFARLRLINSDLDTLRLRMLQRRGLDRVMGIAPSL